MIKELFADHLSVNYNLN